MTPNDIEVLIHYHVCPAPFPRIDAPAVIGAIKMLIENGLMVGAISNNSLGTTDKGAAHVRQLCNLPFPVESWADSQGQII